MNHYYDSTTNATNQIDLKKKKKKKKKKEDSCIEIWTLPQHRWEKNNAHVIQTKRQNEKKMKKKKTSLKKYYNYTNPNV